MAHKSGAAPLPKSVVEGKGQVPASKTAPTAVVVTGGAGAAGLSGWIGAHPWEVAALVGAMALAGAGLLLVIEQRRQTKQQSVIPGFGPVPATVTGA
jgi:hypothetical protein